MEEPALFTAAEWNVQALFDGQEKGNEYGEYLGAAGWTPEKYTARLTAISQALLQMAVMPEGKTAQKPVPDLVGFVEIENARVLEDLAGGALSKYGYSWTAFANVPGSPLGIGFLSRFPIEETKVHSITAGKETAPRPVLELRVAPGGKPLVFMLCHWKSKLGGDNATEVLRRASARVIQRRLREIKQTEPGTPVIIMGDLNENHDEFSRRSGKYLCALLPDTPNAAALAGRSRGALRECLVLSGENPPRASAFPDDACVLYSPWAGELEDGSYYYQGGWETIDHFLLSDGLFDGAGWEYSGCRVLNQEPFTGAEGVPIAYNPRTGRGLSDHLPLVLHLENR